MAASVSIAAASVAPTSIDASVLGKLLELELHPASVVMVTSEMAPTARSLRAERFEGLVMFVGLVMFIVCPLLTAQVDPKQQIVSITTNAVHLLVPGTTNKAEKFCRNAKRPPEGGRIKKQQKN
jgi:hypothetical protein